MPKEDAASLTQHPAEGNCVAALMSENRYARLREHRREIAGKSCYGYHKRVGEGNHLKGDPGAHEAAREAQFGSTLDRDDRRHCIRLPAGAGGSPNPGPPAGAILLSPTQGFDFEPYIKRLLPVFMRNGMKQMPEDAKMGAMGAVAVVVTIQKDGTLVGQGPTTDVGSRYKDMDRAALEAIRASAPFDYLPDGFKGAELKLRVTFFYNVRPPLPTH